MVAGFMAEQPDRIILSMLETKNIIIYRKYFILC